jgi:hypothetical protein
VLPVTTGTDCVCAEPLVEPVLPVTSGSVGFFVVLFFLLSLPSPEPLLSLEVELELLELVVVAVLLLLDWPPLPEPFLPSPPLPSPPPPIG